MAQLNPYYVKIKVYCKDNTEAQAIQNAVYGVSSDVNLIGSELLQFYSKYKQNENVIKPVLSDVVRNGVSSLAKHIPKLLKLR